MTAVHAGAAIVIERSSNPAALCRTIDRESVTGLAGVPLFWHQLAGRLSPFFGREYVSLCYITNTGGAMDPGVIARMRAEKPNVKVFLMYRFTEAFRSTYLPPTEIDRRPGSIGSAIPNTEILVVDADGRTCAAGETGELVHRGPTVAAGYWDDPVATARTFRQSPLRRRGEIVTYSGDLVRRDSDGYLYFVGRRDELFKSRGIRVNAEQIEIELRRSESVSDAIVFPVAAQEGFGEPEIVALFVPAAPEVQVSDVRQFCRTELPVHLRSARLEPVEAIPETPHGKPDRARAREL